MLRRTVLTLLVASSLPLSARAECFILTAQYALSEKQVEMVFLGRVVEVTRTSDLGYRATFEVERVWKGPVPKRLDVYISEMSLEAPRYEKGREYVALVRRLTDDRVRDDVGLGGTNAHAYTAVGCSGFLTPNIERDLGAGYAPTEIVKKDKN